MLCPIGKSNEKLTIQVLAKWWEYVTPIILCTFCLIKDMEFSHAFLYSSYNVLKRQDDKDYYMKRGLKWKRRHT